MTFAKATHFSASLCVYTGAILCFPHPDKIYTDALFLTSPLMFLVLFCDLANNLYHNDIYLFWFACKSVLLLKLSFQVPGCDTCYTGPSSQPIETSAVPLSGNYIFSSFQPHKELNTKVGLLMKLYFSCTE